MKNEYDIVQFRQPFNVLSRQLYKVVYSLEKVNFNNLTVDELKFKLTELMATIRRNEPRATGFLGMETGVPGKVFKRGQINRLRIYGKDHKTVMSITHYALHQCERCDAPDCTEQYCDDCKAVMHDFKNFKR